MCHPPGKRGTELGAQIFADVKVSDARPSTEPLQDSANGKINAESTHVDGNRSRGLKNIKYHVRANAMCAFHNRMSVHNVRATVKNLRNWHEERCLVDGSEQCVKINT